MRFSPTVILVTFFLVACPVLAGTGWAAPEGTGLPLPRFVNLRANEANMRTGPGVQYPVEWVFVRPDLPLEVIAEYRTWRKVRDWQGTQGWMHQSMLDSRRTVIVTGVQRTLRKRGDTESAAQARVEAGVSGRLLECPDAGGWCRVEIDGFEGWLRRVEFWGVYAKEVLR
ncbi:MAG: SH3 domain-containing protein [Rhodospirillales bacterium]|jgi:SH3-like domain-containing protein|nr:SH3 domain-containing protein [Rhodospirillales bacterium]